MTQIQSFNDTPAEHFEDYDELSKCITTIENIKLLAKCPDFMHLNWSFTVYAP